MFTALEYHCAEVVLDNKIFSTNCNCFKGKEYIKKTQLVLIMLDIYIPHNDMKKKKLVLILLRQLLKATFNFNSARTNLSELSSKK